MTKTIESSSPYGLKDELNRELDNLTYYDQIYDVKDVSYQQERLDDGSTIFYAHILYSCKR